MDDRRIHLLLLSITLVCQLALISSGCQNESATTSTNISTESKKPEKNEVEKKEPSPEEVIKSEIEATFKEFLAAQEEPDPEKWKQRYDKSFEMLVKSGKEALPTLAEALKNKDQRVRESASIIISAIGPSTPEDSSQFIPFLKDESEMVRVNLVACFSLVPEHTEVAIAELKELLKSEDDSIRSTAAGSAANLGEKAAPLADLLLEIVAIKDSKARNLGLEALERISSSLTAEQWERIEAMTKEDSEDPEITEKLENLLSKSTSKK